MLMWCHNSEAVEDRQSQGLLLTQVFIDGIDMNVWKALSYSKSDPNIHIMTHTDQVMKFAQEVNHHVSVNCAHNTVCATIFLCIL